MNADGTTEEKGGRLAAVGDDADLAREAAAAFARMVDAYRKHFQLSVQEALDRAGEHRPDLTERALAAPPDQVQWFDLNRIAEQDPERARQRWREIVEAARGELRSGHRAARPLEGYDGSCWQRAQFLALRAELTAAWGPRNPLEQLLVDQLAQFQALGERWLETLTAYTALGGLNCRRAAKGEERYAPPRLSEAEAVERAAAMVERCQRLGLRALKALQDQRRLGPPVVVRRAVQVNVGGQQINVAGIGPAGGDS